MQTYLLLGAGGTGSHFIRPALTYLENFHHEIGTEWQFVVVDGDAYSPDNLTRQMFEPGLVSLNKATAMAQMYNRFPVIPVPRFIGKDDLQTIFNDGDVVFIGVDNYALRALVEERALELQSCVVINAGNEEFDGSVQLWVRMNGQNLTPRLTYGHPEIKYDPEEDRAPMSCEQVAALPGGGQTLLANMAAAHGMLTALFRYHEGLWTEGWTEYNFDLRAGTAHFIDMRQRRNWAR